MAGLRVLSSGGWWPWRLDQPIWFDGQESTWRWWKISGPVWWVP